MNSHHSGLSKPSGKADDLSGTCRRWPSVFVAIASLYYVISAVTLPFVNSLWLGEVPLLAFFQLPKSILKSFVHKFLMLAAESLGLSQGSFSPDYMVTHGWAMLIMVTVPAIVVVTVILLLRPFVHRTWLTGILVMCASLDAIVTLWFDRVSSLKLYNAAYF